MRKQPYNVRIVEIRGMRMVSGFLVYWEEPTLGFGCLSLVQNPDGSLVIDTENMSKGFVKAVFDKMLEQATYN